jgi:hypothetical protein
MNKNRNKNKNGNKNGNETGNKNKSKNKKDGDEYEDDAREICVSIRVVHNSTQFKTHDMLPRLIFSIQGMLLKQKLGNEEATIT